MIKIVVEFLSILLLASFAILFIWKKVQSVLPSRELIRTKLSKQIKDRQNSGGKIEEILVSLLGAAKTSSEVRGLLLDLKKIGFSSEQLSAALASNRFNLQDIADLFNEAMEYDAVEFFNGLSPLVRGTTAEEKSVSLLKLVQKIEACNWQDGDYGSKEPREFVEPMLKSGCSPKAVMEILRQESDLKFWNIAESLPKELRADLAALGALASSANIDLSKDEELEELIDSDLSWSEVAVILIKSGMDIKNVVECIANNTELEDEASELMAAFKKQGLSSEEILSVLYQSGLDLAAVLDLALREKLSSMEVAEFLKKEKVDPEEADEVLSSDLDVELKRRVEILHILFKVGNKKEAVEV